MLIRGNTEYRIFIESREDRFESELYRLIDRSSAIKIVRGGGGGREEKERGGRGKKERKKMEKTKSLWREARSVRVSRYDRASSKRNGIVCMQEHVPRLMAGIRARASAWQVIE